jgi:hypothetical protein
MFVLAWGWVGGFVAFISMGSAPLPLMLGLPTILATLLSVSMLASSRVSHSFSPRRVRLARTVETVEFALFGLFLPLVSVALLVVAALPLSGVAEVVSMVVGLSASLFAAAAVAYSDLKADRQVP